MTRKLLFALIAILCSASAAKADTDISAIDNILYMKPTTITAGTTGTLSINMKNSADVQSIGLYFYLPEGMAVPDDEGDLLINLSTARTRLNRHSLSSNYLPNLKEYRVGILQLTGKAFTGNDGEVFTIDVSVPKDMLPGDYVFKMTNQEFSNIDGILMNKGVFEGTITVTKADGVTEISSDAINGDGDIYNVGGMKVQCLQNGLNIVRQADGKTIKIAR